jgi:hypothetical protein
MVDNVSGVRRIPARANRTSMARLLITRGPPASGKTTFARKLQPRVARVNRDDLRLMLHGRRLFTETAETPVTHIQRMAVEVPLEEGIRRDAAVLVDIDGTVALRGDRSPYAWEQVGSDSPNPAVIEAVRAMHAAGNAIVFCSGRDEEARAETEAWLDLFVGVPYEGLLLRPAGDNRKDAVVKREIFDGEIRRRWRVVGVFDDRREVVRMWRELGLTVFQVAEGDF